MRPLNSNEEPVLPVGVQNLVTGKNLHFDVDLNNIRSCSLIEVESYEGSRKYKAIILGGGAKSDSTPHFLSHDQTHRPIGSYKLIQEFHGSYKDMFKQIQNRLNKKGVKAYVYK